MTPIEQAQLLYSAAREAKREGSRQRRLARLRMQQLEGFCSRNGIELELVKAQTEEKRHGRERQH